MLENAKDQIKMHQEPQKDAATLFKIKTGYNCLAEHLHITGFLSMKECQIYGEGTLNAEHLSYRD